MLNTHPLLYPKEVHIARLFIRFYRILPSAFRDAVFRYIGLPCDGRCFWNQRSLMDSGGMAGQNLWHKSLQRYRH
jgi:hypothetical protein